MLKVNAFLGRTGPQLMLQDEYRDYSGLFLSSHSSQPLLVLMSQPPFTTALAKFQTRTCYSNITNDPVVHFCTGAIAAKNPFRRIDSEMVCVLAFLLCVYEGFLLIVEYGFEHMVGFNWRPIFVVELCIYIYISGLATLCRRIIT